MPDTIALAEQMLAQLGQDHDEMWAGRSAGFLEALTDVLVPLVAEGVVEGDAAIVRHMDLREAHDLAWFGVVHTEAGTRNLPSEASDLWARIEPRAARLRAYLGNLPGLEGARVALDEPFTDTAVTQHGYVTMPLVRMAARHAAGEPVAA